MWPRFLPGAELLHVSTHMQVRLTSSHKKIFRMSAATQSHLKPPRGLIEAARKLADLDALTPATKARRVRQAAECLYIAVEWAETLAVSVDAADAWLRTAIAEMKRAEPLLRALAEDAERDRAGWEVRMPELRRMVDQARALYVTAEAAPSITQRKPVRHRPISPPLARGTGQSVSLDDISRMFEAAIEKLTLREGLAFVLEQTEYRFIGIWRFEAGEQSVLVHFDRDDPNAVFNSRAADNCSGCVYLKTRTGMRTLDEILAEPGRKLGSKRANAYSSVPVVDTAGHVLATLCLHDVVARPSYAEDTVMLRLVASILSTKWKELFPELKVS